MRSIHLCVTTFNRQDMLEECLASACAGTLRPLSIFIVDQAGRRDLIDAALRRVTCPVSVIDLGEKRGCESSAINFYLQAVPEERVISHDDVVFGPESLEKFVATPGAFVIDQTQGVLTYRDRARNRAGLYDVNISPNFYRYCDVDYEDRLALVGIHPTVVDCGITHKPNGTMAVYNPEQLADYKRRHDLAQRNYELKWRRKVTPGGDTIGRGQWRQTNGA